MPKKPKHTPATSLPKPRKCRNSLCTYVDGGRIIFGKWDDPAALKRFAEFYENRNSGKNLPTPDSPTGGVHAPQVAFNSRRSVPIDTDCPTVADLAAGFMDYAAERKKSHYFNFKAVCQALLRYANLTTAEFDVFLLLQVQQGFVQHGYARTHVNQLVNFAIAIFRWGELRRLVPPGKSGQLRAIEPLRRGDARESDDRGDVSDDVFERTLALPHLLPVYRDCFRIIRLTGARPSEIARMKVGDVNRNNSLWEFCPKNHKTARHNIKRVIVFGQRGGYFLSGRGKKENFQKTTASEWG